MPDSSVFKTATITLVAILSIGLGLIVFAVYYSIEIMKLEFIFNIDINIALFSVMVMILTGFLMVIVGIIQSVGVINRIKKYMDKVVENDDFNEQRNIQTGQFQQSPTSIGGGLRIIRGQMPQSMPEKEQTKKPAKSQTTKKIETNVKKDSIKSVQSAKKAPKSAKASGPTVSLEEGLQIIVDNYNTEKVKRSFKGWHNTLMMNFKDLGKSYLFKVDGANGLELSEGVDDSAAVQVVIDSDIFKKMMSKQINPIKAYSSGHMSVKGQMKNMLKLRKLMF